MKVINLWSGPGAGKSTTAAGLFHNMKLAGKRVELVTEYAKDLTYENNPTISNQLSVLAEQDARLRRLLGKVDYAITDSPLPLSLIYAKAPFDTYKFGRFVMELWRGYENENFFLERVKPYQEYGRSQNEGEAREIDSEVWAFLSRHAIPFTRVAGNKFAPSVIEARIERGI